MQNLHFLPLGPLHIVAISWYLWRLIMQKLSNRIAYVIVMLHIPFPLVSTKSVEPRNIT